MLCSVHVRKEEVRVLPSSLNQEQPPAAPRMSLPSLPVGGRTTGFVASSYATMHGSGWQPAAPSCGWGHVQGKGRTDANTGMMPMLGGAPPSPLYGLQLTAKVAGLSTEV